MPCLSPAQSSVSSFNVTLPHCSATQEPHTPQEDGAALQVSPHRLVGLPGGKLAAVLMVSTTIQAQDR